MKKQRIKNEAIIFQGKTGAIELKGDFRMDTIWANQEQIADIFGIERSVVTKHIRNILNDKELNEKAVCAKFAHTAEDGKTYQVQFYSLDVILGVGYRTSSSRATQFRIWATKVLREHITKGYSINRKRISENYDAFIKAMSDIQALLPEQTTVRPADVLDLVKEFASTWISLDAYDKDKLVVSGVTKKSVHITGEQLTEALMDLKRVLIKKGEATELFGKEKQTNTVVGIVGNVMQTFGGKALYSSVEEKAANLLYFMIKDHPFADGNKRSGAFAFVWFLQKAGLLRRTKITPPALTAITLFIAESNPKHKDKMVRVVMQLLKK